MANSRPFVSSAHGQACQPGERNPADCPRLSIKRGQAWTGSVVPGLQDGSDLFCLIPCRRRLRDAKDAAGESASPYGLPCEAAPFAACCSSGTGSMSVRRLLIAGASFLSASRAESLKTFGVFMLAMVGHPRDTFRRAQGRSPDPGTGDAPLKPFQTFLPFLPLTSRHSGCSSVQAWCLCRLMS